MVDRAISLAAVDWVDLRQRRLKQIAFLTHYTSLDPLDARQCDVEWLSDFAEAVAEIVREENEAH